MLTLAADAPETVKPGLWVQSITLEATTGGLLSIEEVERAKSRAEISRTCVAAGTKLRDHYATLLLKSSACQEVRPPQIDEQAHTFRVDLQCNDKTGTGSIGYSGSWTADGYAGRVEVLVKKPDGTSGTINASFKGVYSGSCDLTEPAIDTY